MPVLDVGGDCHDAALMQTDSRLALLLIPALAGGAEQKLTAALGSVVDMPVVTTPRLEAHIGGKQTALRVGQRV